MVRANLNLYVQRQYECVSEGETKQEVWNLHMWLENFPETFAGHFWKQKWEIRWTLHPVLAVTVYESEFWQVCFMMPG